MSVNAWPDQRPGTASVALLETLYPPPLVISPGTRSTAATRVRYLALPSVARARLIVPAHPAQASRRAVRRQLSGQRTRTRAARLGLGILAATGMLPRVPGTRLYVSGPQSSPCIEDPLRVVLGRDSLRLTMPLGPPRANRKPVLQVTDDTGAVLAYAKVGHNDLTRRLVRREAEALRRLQTARLEHVRAPRVLGLVDWQGLCVLVIEPLDTEVPRLRGQPARQRLLAVVDDIAGVFGVTNHRWRESPLRSRLTQEAASCGTLAAPVLRLVESLASDVVVPTGAWHGDLNPGNVALTNGRCPVWDWERFTEQVPIGFDLLHHDLHRDITVSGEEPRRAVVHLLANAHELLSPWRLTPEVADTVVRAYLLLLAQRYLADGQARAGTQLGQVADWLLPALESTA